MAKSSSACALRALLDLYLTLNSNNPNVYFVILPDKSGLNDTFLIDGRGKGFRLVQVWSVWEVRTVHVSSLQMLLHIPQTTRSSPPSLTIYKRATRGGLTRK